jgi:hypothetical protein
MFVTSDCTLIVFVIRMMKTLVGFREECLKEWHLWKFQEELQLPSTSLANEHKKKVFTWKIEMKSNNFNNKTND